MFDRSRISEFTIPVSLFVLVLLFFPAAHGSFVATHGPVTALRSLRVVAAILLAISAFCVLLTLQLATSRRAVARIEAERGRKAASADREHTCSRLC